MAKSVKGKKEKEEKVPVWNERDASFLYNTMMNLALKPRERIGLFLLVLRGVKVEWVPVPGAEYGEAYNISKYGAHGEIQIQITTCQEIKLTDKAKKYVEEHIKEAEEQEVIGQKKEQEK